MSLDHDIGARGVRRIRHGAVMLAVCVAGVLAAGVPALGSQESCDRGRDRWSGGREGWIGGGHDHVRGHGHHHRFRETRRFAGTLIIDGCSYRIAAAGAEARIINAFRREGFRASIVRGDCGGRMIRVCGMPCVRWCAERYETIITHDCGDTYIRLVSNDRCG